MGTWQDYAWGLFAGIAVLLAVAWAIVTVVVLDGQGMPDGRNQLISVGVLIAMELSIGAMVAIAAWHRTVWGCTLNHDGTDGSCQRHQTL